MKKMKVLFICTGNTCRSPMAEGIMADMAKKTKSDIHIETVSAGIYTISNSGPSSNAVEVMKERNIDISGHSSKRVSEELISDVDLVLTMTASHKAQIYDIFAHIEPKVYTLGEMAEEVMETDHESHFNTDKEEGLQLEQELSEYDISDPFGGSIQTYRECANQIESALKKVIKKLLKK